MTDTPERQDENGSDSSQSEPIWQVARPDDPIDWGSSSTTTAVLERPRVEAIPEAAGAAARAPSRLLSAFMAAVLGAVLGTGATLAATRRGGTSAAVQVAPPVKGSSAEASDVSAVAKAVLPWIVRVDVREAGPFGQTGEGTGSGVIYNADGYIVTNNHVVQGASDVRVTLSDGSTFPARVVGTAAPAVDIAVLKIDKTGLKAAVFGSVRDLEVGQLAVAIGSPFGLQGSVTSGVISALHRNITLDQDVHFSDAIQTDAPINPGNSGGALADRSGRVIGINTAILSQAGGNVGVGFAIPIDIVRRVADQIIRTGHAQLPFLGITGQNLPNRQGALIQDVVAGGPAARAGLRSGDIIVALDGTKVASMDDLISFLIAKEVGQVVSLEYLRDGKRQKTTARLSSRPGG